MWIPGSLIAAWVLGCVMGILVNLVAHSILCDCQRASQQRMDSTEACFTSCIRWIVMGFGVFFVIVAILFRSVAAGNYSVFLGSCGIWIVVPMLTRELDDRCVLSRLSRPPPADMV